MTDPITSGWLLLIFTVGTGGSSISTLGPFANELACNAMEAEVRLMVSTALPGLQKTNPQLGAAWVTKCEDVSKLGAAEIRQ